jgi:trimeric autotransporter adhesin
VTVTVSYTGGNGGPYDAQEIASTGVLGLTANWLRVSSMWVLGSVVLEISGTALSTGVAVFFWNWGERVV